MMKRGFTLIELLAVIVILAIIATIATPIVLSIINDVKNEATYKTADFYIGAIEKAIVSKKIEVRGFIPTSCEIQNDGNLLCDKVLVEVEVNGEKPISGGINFENNKIIEAELIYENVIFRQDSFGNMTQEQEYSSNDPENTIYFDVSKGNVCSKKEYNVQNSKTGYNGLNGTGDQTSCLKFYKFSDNDNGTVNLLLDHNTTAVHMWYDGIVNVPGPIDTLSQLNEDTSQWNGTIELTSSVTLNGYTIDYTGFKARLISASEIAQIVGHTSWDGLKLIKNNTNGNWYYFTSKNLTESNTCKQGNTSGCNYRWLYDRTSLTCKTKGCLNNSNVETFGFWTDTALPTNGNKVNRCNGYVAFGVSHRGRLGVVCVNYDDHYGIRPVITISNDKLK